MSVNGTLSIDLSYSWTIGGVVPKFTVKPSNMTLARRPMMWYNSGPNTVYSGGGWHYDGAENYTLWSFQPDGKGGANWNQDVIGDLYTQQYIPTIGSAFTASNTSFYSLGGADSTANDVASDLDLALQGLVTQEAATGVWSNYSSTGASHSGRSVFAEAVFMPSFGQGGLLAFVGGESPSNSTYHYNPTSTDTAFVSMSNITIYDPNTSTWYHQKSHWRGPTSTLPVLRSGQR
jgi:hypothetical protein